ncbi:MAG: tRNA lysidine(34) synthetase TilS [Ignavibacteriaceae bacterium]|nr:tRNA lysidine(34) synthetase TilS [Ignavibacteriaceae bacterium]
MKKTEQKVLKFIDEHSLIPKGSKILVALSGGPDSVFLLCFLKKYQKRLSVSISAFHLNHMLRGKDASGDEQFCKHLCSSLNIPFYSVKKNVKQYAQNKKISIEEAGRILRYSELNKLLKKIGFDTIATAHNCDDNAETVLLNLIKGTGLKGISGIPEKRDNIIRPILVLPKKEILKYLELNKIKFRIDSSNLEIDFERNFIRHILLPAIRSKLNPSVENAIFNSSMNFRSLYSFLLNSTNNLTKDITTKDSSLNIPLNRLSELNGELLTFYLKELIDRNFSGNLTFKDISSLKSLIYKQTGRSDNLSSGLTAYKERNDLIIKENKNSFVYTKKDIQLNLGEEKTFENYTLSIKPVDIAAITPGKEKSREFISADNILDAKFVVRNWKDGDIFFPLGMKGTKKISDFLNGLKIPSHKKKNQLVLLNGNRIVWVIGYRLDDRFKITKDTKQVVELCLKSA